MAATSPEALLISAVLLTADHVTAQAHGINQTHFHAYPDEWEFVETYIGKYKRTPSKVNFQKKFPEFVIKKVDDVAAFAEEVREAHASGILRDSMSEAIEHLRNGDIRAALKNLHTSTLLAEAASDGGATDGDIIRDYADVYNEVERRTNRVASMGQAGIPTGFPTLDDRTGGPQPGQFWVVAARLGQGKTWSLVRMAVAAAFSGFTVQYDALEQSRQEIAMRVFSFASSEYGQEVFKNLDQSMGLVSSLREYREFLDSMRNSVKGKFHVADTSRGAISPMSIAAQIERNRPDAVYLDYLTLMDHGAGPDDNWRGIAKLSGSLKRTAQQYHVPIIAAAQLNRTAIGNRPAGPEALAESDSIGRDADAVITMVALSKRVIQMKLAKYRHGRDGFSWYCVFMPNTGHFEEITKDRADELIAEDKDEESEDNIFKPRVRGSYTAAANRNSLGGKVPTTQSDPWEGKTRKRIVRRRSQ